MSNAKHTPGPWKTTNGNTGNYISVFNEDQTKRIAKVFQESPVSQDERGANAKLIAAAPDLLSACYLAYAKLTSIGENNCDLTAKILSEAIKKATE